MLVQTAVEGYKVYLRHHLPVSRGVYPPFGAIIRITFLHGVCSD